MVVMAGTFTIAGKKIPKWAVFGIAGTGIVAGVLYYRHEEAVNAASNTASSSPADNPDAIDPVTGLPYSEDNEIDPETGMTYLAEAQEYGSVAAAEAAYSEAAEDSEAGDSGLAYDEPASNVSTAATSGITTNSEWASQAVADLEALGYSSADATSAIAAYLAGMTLTSDQASLVQTAVAELGPPPAGSFSITTAPSTTTSASGSTSTTTASSSSSSSSGDWSYPAPTNLQAGSGGAGKIDVSWNAVVGPQDQKPDTYTIAYGRTSGAQTWKVTTPATSTVLTTQKGMTEYIEVWANGGPKAPPHAGPVKATAGS